MPELNYDMCMAAGADAGDYNMKKHGRSLWDDDDWDIASKTANELLHKLQRHIPCPSLR